jgi:hypothetical protein
VCAEDVERAPVFQFLAEVGLLEYARSFVEHGLGNVGGAPASAPASAAILELTEAQLDRVGVIPSEHRRYLTRTHRHRYKQRAFGLDICRAHVAYARIGILRARFAYARLGTCMRRRRSPLDDCVRAD